MRIYRLDLKNIRLHGLVPLLAAWVMTPLLFYLVSLSGYGQGNVLDASLYTQVFLPFFSIWWIVFIFRQYADASGRELLHLYRKSQLMECLFLQILFAAAVALPFFALSFFYEGMLSEYLRILVESIFLSSLAYCVIFVFRSATAALLLCLIYAAFSWILKADVLQYVSVFSIGILAARVPVWKNLTALGLSALFLLVGAWRNRRLF